MSERLFRFKQFSLRQDYAAMRITTDGVLLGAWASCEGARTILDIGAGTGLIALMLAQRCPAGITALEPDESSCKDLRYNVAHAPWAERIIVCCMSLQEFTEQTGETDRFDMIVSNPPYFSDDKLPEHPGDRTSRHALTLTHGELIRLGASLLSQEGRFSMILPARYEAKIIALASQHRLFCNRLLRVRPRAEKPVNRVLLEFGREKSPLQTDHLTIHHGDGYTGEFTDLTKAYYPAF